MNTKIMTICRGALLIAAAMVLSYIKIDIAALGGSLNLVMVPLVIFSIMYGPGWGIAAGLLYGTMKFFFAGGTAVNWQSMLLDYTLAYGAVGFAGLCRNAKYGMVIGALVGGIGRFIVHFISGVTIYAEYAEDTFLGIATPNDWIYSLVYNGSYMVPCIIITMVCCALLAKPLAKYLKSR